MKKTFLILAVSGFMVGTMLTACKTPNKNIESAKDHMESAKDQVKEATQDVDQSLKESIRQFKRESQETISNNEKRIAEFKVKMENGERLPEPNTKSRLLSWNKKTVI